jgi:hypothetical protein
MCLLIWMKYILSCIDFVPMILFSFVMFRQKIQSFWKEISIATLAGTIVTYAGDLPLLHIAILFVLFLGFLKFHAVPAMLIALSGYIMSVIVSTAVIIFCDITDMMDYPAVYKNLFTSNLMLVLGIIVKCCVILAMIRFRLGFTFLAHYSKIKLCKENAGFYLFILIAIVGIAYRNTLQENMLSALMPIQMLGMATIIFVYVTLRKELGF